MLNNQNDSTLANTVLLFGMQKSENSFVFRADVVVLFRFHLFSLKLTSRVALFVNYGYNFNFISGDLLNSL